MEYQNGGHIADYTENRKKLEQIGKVRMNLVHYSGEDLYSDGEIEDELLIIARDYAEVEYPRIIEEKKSWPILYHLSKLRENIVEWLPIDKNMKVLEIGSGCGAITGVLAKKAGEVTCIDLSRKRSLINAYRHMDCDNVTIHVGNFQDIEPDIPKDYDFICLIGVFEYGQAYINSDTPYEDFLRIVTTHKKPEGHIAIAIENKFGLKYWAGCKEDHLGTWFSGLEDYPEGGVVRTFTRNGLLRIASACGFTETQMYYPYPDYKFMTRLYSDEYLPKPGELSDNLRNFDRDRLQLFDEKLVFDTIIREGQFPLFSNSYMLLLGPKLPLQYVKYSNDRAASFRIKTVIRKQENRCVEKYPLSDEAAEHIEQIHQAGINLQKRYAGGKLMINACSLHDYRNITKVSDYLDMPDISEGSKSQQSVFVSFPYIEGRTLEELLDERLEKEDLDGFYALFDEYLEHISEGEDRPVADYDLIFSNILITPEGEWHVIDYEWTFDKEMETKEIAFRAIYCYLLEYEKRNKLNLDILLDKLQITQADAELYRKQERAFQQYVTGKRLSMSQIREQINQPVYTFNALESFSPDDKRKGQLQIYEDRGSGFKEDYSYFPEESDSEEQSMQGPGAHSSKDGIVNQGLKTYTVVSAGGLKGLRIDPCSDRCIVWLKEVKWNDKTLPLKGKTFSHNGFRIGENTYAFHTEDPGFTILLGETKQQDKNILQVSLQVTRMPEETIAHMQRRGFW